MPIPYDRKRQLLLEKKQQLVPALQKHISLRNVPDALKLPAQAQETLAQALEQGVQKQRLALQFLQREPAATIEQLLAAVGGEADIPFPLNKGDTHPRRSDKGVSQDSKPDASALVNLLFDYGLYENRMIAETVASAEYMAGVLEVVLALEQVREPQGAETETVTLALCAVAVRLIDKIDHLLKEKYAHRMAVLQAEKLDWSRFMPKDSLPLPSLGREDVLALSKMIKAGSGLGHAEAEQAAERESLAGLLHLVSLYRNLEAGFDNTQPKESSQDRLLFLAARAGFAVSVVTDLLSCLRTIPAWKKALSHERSDWPLWFREQLETLDDVSVSPDI